MAVRFYQATDKQAAGLRIDGRGYGDLRRRRLAGIEAALLRDGFHQDSYTGDYCQQWGDIEVTALIHGGLDYVCFIANERQGITYSYTARTFSELRQWPEQLEAACHRAGYC